jgi:hypothetical protein
LLPIRILSYTQASDHCTPTTLCKSWRTPSQTKILSSSPDKTKVERESDIHGIFVAQTQKWSGQGNEIDGLDVFEKVRSMLLNVSNGIELDQAA